MVGFAQALALIPGVSRSGATITAGLFLGLDRPSRGALLVPAVGAGGGPLGLLELGSILSGRGGPARLAGNLLLATVLAFVTGYAAIAWLLRFLATHSTLVFVVYRVVLGTLVLVLAAAGRSSSSRAIGSP